VSLSGRAHNIDAVPLSASSPSQPLKSLLIYCGAKENINYDNRASDNYK